MGQTKNAVKKKLIRTTKPQDTDNLLSRLVCEFNDTEIYINGVKIKALVDSGSTVTCLRT